MDKHFICLANSYKRGGRCVAGVEIDIDADNRWSVRKDTTGKPIWIRPIDRHTEYGEIPEGDAHFLPLLSIVKITDVIPCPQYAHSEDAYFDSMFPIGKVLPYPEVMWQLADYVHPVLFYDSEYSISIDAYNRGDYSLMLIHPESFSFHLDPTKARAKYFMTFRYNGVTYDFSVTDPYFYAYINQNPDALESLSDVYLVLSLGLEYEERHHKLIAAVIIPSKATPAINPQVIVQESLHEKSVRQFTRQERRVYRRAIVVPSQEGLSLYLKRKDGKDRFILLESGCHLESWQKVNLKTVSLVTYEDECGQEVYRIRKYASPREWGFMSLLRCFLRLKERTKLYD